MVESREEPLGPGSADELLHEYLTLLEADSELSFDQWVARHRDREVEVRTAWEDWSRGQRLLREASASRWSEQRLEPGLTIGSFTLIRPLGHGAQGTVWEARQTSLDRHVALKIVRAEGVDSRALAYLRREARAAARISHPNLVVVHDWGRAENVLWIAQELIPGGRTLRHLIDERSRSTDPMSPDWFAQVAELMKKVSGAIHAAHEQGVIHRDLKPENILLAEDEPKVSDFGLARISDESALSTTGDVVGTLRYMSPEQTRGESLDAQSDVFSLGSILFELLTLERAFGGSDPAGVVARISNARVANPTDVNPRVPTSLGRIARKCLQKKRGSRYRSSGELSADLAHFNVEGDTGREVLRHLSALPKRWSVAVVGILATTLLLTWVLSDPVFAKDPVWIEWVPPSDPDGSGGQFKNHNELDYHVRAGLGVIESSNGRMGSFSTSVGGPQYRRLEKNGWILELQAQLRTGYGWAFVDFIPNGGNRFDICLLMNGGEPGTALSGEGLQFLHRKTIGPGFHVFRLEYDPASKTAEFFMDGELVVSGYRGTNSVDDSFPEDATGLAFGAGPRQDDPESDEPGELWVKRVLLMETVTPVRD